MSAYPRPAEDDPNRPQDDAEDDAFAAADLAARTIELDPASAGLLSLPERPLFFDLLERAHADDRVRLRRAMDTVLVTLGLVALKFRATAFDGSPRIVSARMRYAYGLVQLRVIDVADPAPDGAPAFPNALARMRDAQRRGEQRLALAAIATRDVLWDWDAASDTYYVSPRLGELLGHDKIATELDADAFSALMHPDDVAAEREARRRHVEEYARYDVDYRLRTATGDYRWFRAVGEVLRDEGGAPLHMAGTISDIDTLRFAERQMIEQRNELEGMTRELHDMSLRLVKSQEDERRHIARELHDQTGQTLTAAVLDLEFWRGKGVPPEEIDRVLVEVKRALGEIRDISLRLRPPMLDEAGLENALRSYLDRQAAAGKFEVTLAAEGYAERLSAEVEITAFRLVQEAVTNIIRHAGARHVDVALKVGAGEIVIRISDDGSGCVAEDAMTTAKGGSSLGLISMNERAALLGGRCEFISMPGVGSIVLARIPLG